MQPSSSSHGAGSSNVPHLPDSHNHEGKGRDDTDAFINERRNNLTRLKKEFVDTRLHLDKLEALLSPIRLLPIEVLGEIFNYCLDDTSLEPMSLNSGPLLMTHVCSTWRRIAINKSNLWANIWVTIDNDEDRGGWPALVKLWIERSGQLPLRFHIQETEKHDYAHHPDSVFFRVLDVLLPQAHRWKSAELLNRNFQATADIQWFRNLPERPDFPLLESFTLQARRMEQQELARVTEMIRQSPRLQSVTWMIKTAVTMPTLPWAQLTHLTLIFICSLDMTLDILLECPHLHQLDVSVQLIQGTQALRHVTHTSLETLYFSCSGILGPLFDAITLPRVKDLTIDQMPDIHVPEIANGPWPHTAFMEFLKRSNCALEKFSMMDIVVVNDADLIDLLRGLSPSLVHLVIDNEDCPCVTDAVLRALSYPIFADYVREHGVLAVTKEALGDVLCPRLRELRLNGCMVSTDGVLADMVESRWDWPSDDFPVLQGLLRCDLSVHSPPARPLDQERIKVLHSNRIKYNIIDTY
ncbi:hypothetical protein BJ912DRAFT_859623 [Pholiota molesta]|nr:hypothetical protein BJ912DRAFT_859623 [Pholiota molesta]